MTSSIQSDLKLVTQTLNYFADKVTPPLQPSFYLLYSFDLKQYKLKRKQLNRSIKNVSQYCFTIEAYQQEAYWSFDIWLQIGWV